MIIEREIVSLDLHLSNVGFTYINCTHKSSKKNVNTSEPFTYYVLVTLAAYWLCTVLYCTAICCLTSVD